MRDWFLNAFRKFLRNAWHYLIQGSAVNLCLYLLIHCLFDMWFSLQVAPENLFFNHMFSQSCPYLLQVYFNVYFQPILFFFHFKKSRGGSATLLGFIALNMIYYKQEVLGSTSQNTVQEHENICIFLLLSKMLFVFIAQITSHI